jgi:rhamnulokinase
VGFNVQISLRYRAAMTVPRGWPPATMKPQYLAFDLGAESGRLMRGVIADGKLTLTEIHRFANRPIRAGESLHWNLEELCAEAKKGLQKAATAGGPFVSLSTDAWGVDYVLFRADGTVIEPTYHYRDPRGPRGASQLLQRISAETIFAETGIQHMPINTLFQLAAESPERLASAEWLLSVGDAFNYLLCGVPRTEISAASTFQLYDPRHQRWSERLLAAVQLPERLLPPVVTAGTRLGTLLPHLQRECGLPAVEVVATCSHDTGAAVAAVPARAGPWAYLSSGTWSLMGVELNGPNLSEDCRRLNFTNEIGFGNSVRLLKNISGLWLIQECRREWGSQYDYETLTRLAAEAAPFRALIDPTDPRFLMPDRMPQEIAQFCAETGQAAPATPGATVRCALESLALLYRRCLSEIEELTDQSIEVLHIVGGGSRNQLLNQFTANALGIPVLAGPTEATALGNVIVQALALGQLQTLAEARELVRISSDLRSYDPRSVSAWTEAYGRFELLLRNTSQL